MSSGSGLFTLRPVELAERVHVLRTKCAKLIPDKSLVVVVALGTGLPPPNKCRPPISQIAFIKFCHDRFLKYNGLVPANPSHHPDLYLACAWFFDGNSVKAGLSALGCSVNAAALIVKEYADKYFRSEVSPVLLSIAHSESRAADYLFRTGNNQGLVSQEIWSELNVSEQSLAVDSNIHPPARQVVIPDLADMPELALFEDERPSRTRRKKRPVPESAPIPDMAAVV